MKEFDRSEESIFEESLKLPPKDRKAFVEEQCHGNPKLRDDLFDLLHSHKSAGNFLESLSEKDSHNIAERLKSIAPAEESQGDQIGRYHLLELIGEGAWGSVWMAQQTEDINRRVAVKILKLGLDTKEFLARFEAERQMLAMMEHPNIARVLDAGATEYGRPYLVMELIKGMQLLKYADIKRLTISDRVKLFIKVCHALQHAHQKGVIHRDIKPSNILVSILDDEVSPKVIDFGVAKSNQFRLTDKTLFTSINTHIGTPAYSSPEQFEFSGAEIDQRSDVYSLGAVLYEFLSGTTPFNSENELNTGMEAFRTVILEKEAAKPSSHFSSLSEDRQVEIASKRFITKSKLNSLLKGDLDWIILKCLEKDPKRRYETAHALAADLQAFLDNKPVSAAAPSFTYRIRKSITRKRTAYAIWLEIALLLVAALAVFSFIRPRPSGPPPVEFELTQRIEAPSRSISLTRNSIAVLPFVNTSSDPENEFLSDGLTAEILNALSQIPSLRVPARTSSFVFKGKTDDIKKIGKLLNVDTILEGSVQKSGNQLRVTAQLINVADGYQLWSQKYDREITNIFEIQDDIARSIVNKLQLNLAGTKKLTQKRHPSENAEWPAPCKWTV